MSELGNSVSNILVYYNKDQIVPATVNAEDFHVEKPKRKVILQAFAVECPKCGGRSIKMAKKATIFKRDKCDQCHVKTNLKYVAKVVRFGRNAQWTKLRWINGFSA